MAKSATMPITEDKYVQAFLDILGKNNSAQKAEFGKMLSQVGKMEEQYGKMVSELAAMRVQLAEAEARNHPIRTAMRKAVTAVQERASKLREGLSQLKQSIIEGCKRAVSAFKEQGISALNHVARFFKLQPILASMQDRLDKSIRADDKTIATIEKISTEYHEAGRHLKNIGRAIMGKEAITEAKPIGKVANAFLAPVRADRACCVAMKKCVNSAIGSLTRLEERAAGRTSIKADIQTFNKQIAETQRAAPTPPGRFEPSNPNR